MDAKELTKRFYEIENNVIVLQRKCEYLEQAVEKLLMRMGDVEIDVKGLLRRR